jgi:CRISPR-associated protein Cas2
MLHLILIYDISDDRARAKVATACEDYGLDRIQYSAFYGRLTRNQQEELMMRITKLLRNRPNRPGRVYLIPVGQLEWDKRLEVCVDAG